MQYQLVIFDLDGTILDTLQDLADSLNAALEQSGFPKRSLEEVRMFVGNGIRKLIERGVPAHATEQDVNTVFSHFHEHYTLHCADTTKPYDGILPLLQTLRTQGVKTAVVSNKADYAVQELCRQYFDGLLDYAVGERAGIRKKPCPDSVNEVLEVLGVPCTRAVYVGDSDVDVQTAKNAAMDCIGVSWGFRGRAFLEAHGAVLIADTVAQLQGLLCGSCENNE